MVILGCYILLVLAAIHLFEFLVNLDNLEKLKQMYEIKLDMGLKYLWHHARAFVHITNAGRRKKNLISIKELPPP